MESSISMGLTRELLEDAAEWLDRLTAEEELSSSDKDELARWLNAEATHERALRFLQSKLRVLDSDLVIDKVLNRSVRPDFVSNERDAALVSTVKWATRLVKGNYWRAIASVMLLVGGGVLFNAHRYGEEPLPESPVALGELIANSQIDDSEMIALADGTEVQLSGNTEIQVSQTEQSRLVTLASGAAYFDVAHDKSRPFIIDTGVAEVTVLGTAFDVDKQGDELIVTVDRGHVSVSVEGRQFDVMAGERFKQGSMRAAEVAKFNPESRLDWRAGWIDANQLTLKEALKHIQRYSSKTISVSPKLAERVELIGRFNLTTPEETLKLIGVLHQIDVTMTHSAIYLSEQT